MVGDGQAAGWPVWVAWLLDGWLTVMQVGRRRQSLEREDAGSQTGADDARPPAAGHAQGSLHVLLVAVAGAQT
jgi:hypothetical protein